MVNTKYNFRKYLREKYPDIVASAIYGIPAYTISKPLDEQDSFFYNVQPLPSGQFVAFVGASPSQIEEWMKMLNKGIIPTTSYNNRDTPAPTTFSAFQLWLTRHDISYLNRTYCHKKTPHEIFHTTEINNCPFIEQVGNWYMYEFPSLDTDKTRFAKVPWIQIEGTTIVLAKASPSNYVSKKAAFAQLVYQLSPLYEAIISLCSEANITQSESKWEEAKKKAEEYMHIQFEEAGTINMDEFKEAHRDHTLSLFLRNRDRYHTASRELREEESDF